jgi:4-hydroxy-2-oxovalerate aldolase
MDMTTSSQPLSPPEIFDVTIRDGSYVIDFQFHPEDVRLLCRALEQCGFRYIEVGHGLGLNASAVKEAAAASDEEYLSAAADSCSTSRFGAFFIPGIGTREHLRRARQDFGMHFIRIGSEPDKADAMLPFVEYAQELGFEVMCNFMKSYAAPPAELSRNAAALARAGANAVYVVDSAGGMLPEEVGEYVRAIAEQCPARVGFHGHNNLELAISNSLSAWRNGATLIDCSVGGLGRSSGNARTELFVPVLKALGLPVPYDFEGVLRLWQHMVRPLMQRRPVTPQEIVGGYARVHSGLMGPFVEAARHHKVNLVSLLNAYGDALHTGQEVANIEILATRLRARAVPMAAEGATNSLLRLHAPTDAYVIRNTYRSFDEVIRAVRTLAHKACLPVVALLDVAPSASEEPYLVAEYLYHDEHFIVLRAAFGAVASFIEVMQRHRGWCDVLVFEGRSASVRADLAAREAEWRQGQRVLWTDLAAVKHQALFAALHHSAAERGAGNVLLLGGNPQQLRRFVPPALDALELFCAAPDPHALNRIGITRLNREPAVGPVAAEQLSSQFDIIAVLSPVGGPDAEAVLARLAPGGLLLDCLGPASSPDLDELGRGRSVIRVSLWNAITGALVTLLEAVKNLGTADERERDANRTRAA